MFKRISILFFVFFLFLQCTRDFSTFPIAHESRNLTPLEKELGESGNLFGLKLFREIARTQQDSNIFISPLSISMALAMTWNGAAGATEEAMRNTLEFGDMSSQEINESFRSLIQLLTNLDPDVQFQIANSIWYRLGFNVEKDFIDVNRTYFNAEVRSLDFSLPSAVDVINSWVNENTNGKIKEIIKRIDRETVMFLINAIYFKGTWTYQFDKELTEDDWFIKPDSSQIPCKLMCQEGDFQYFETDDFQAVDLPYGNGRFSMTVILPKPDKSVDSLIAVMTSENWAEWIGSFKKEHGTLLLPRFKLEYEIKLNDMLKSLGMEVAFDSNRADFTRINKEGELYISKVTHKTFVKVDEEGTEAAAVTAVTLGTTSIGPHGFYMKLNRPFLFVIRENSSNTILFIGKIIEPIVG